MTTAKALYDRWINGLWAGKPVAAELVSGGFVGHWPTRDVRGPDELQAIVDETHAMFSELTFMLEVQPFVDGDLLAARWIGTGSTSTGPARFTGNDILRFADERFIEYWTGTSSG
jgi:hypothetical protein